MRYACPCCSYYTFEKKTSGTYYICPVCYWEDDIVQLEDPDFSGGANEVSLNKAKENFKKFGASELRFISKVRRAFPVELNCHVPWNINLSTSLKTLLENFKTKIASSSQKIRHKMNLSNG